jgi:hypothetical protein
MSGVDRKELDAALGDLADVLRQAIKQSLGPLVDRIEALERRVEKAMTYRGAYTRAAGYAPGDTVTHDGSAWVAVRGIGADEAPGASSGWVLAVKRGRDGKDAGR